MLYLLNNCSRKKIFTQFFYNQTIENISIVFKSYLFRKKHENIYCLRHIYQIKIFLIGLKSPFESNFSLFAIIPRTEISHPTSNIPCISQESQVPIVHKFIYYQAGGLHDYTQFIIIDGGRKLQQSCLVVLHKAPIHDKIGFLADDVSQGAIERSIWSLQNIWVKQKAFLWWLSRYV